MEIKFNTRLIAITDIETTGLDSTIHEIIEIGLVLIDQKTFEIIDKFDVKIKPEHPEIFDPLAFERNGYAAEAWQKAISLREAMEQYAKKTQGAIFCAYNATFDWPFIFEAFKKTRLENKMDYHRLDLFTMTWLKLRNSEIEKLRLSEVAKFLGIDEEPMPHRAINGALLAYEVYKRLISMK